MRALALVLAVSLASVVVVAVTAGGRDASPSPVAFGPELDPNGVSRA